MPAEWERHETTWLSWPKNPLTFPPETIGEVERIFLQIIDALTIGEKVSLLVDDLEIERKVRSRILFPLNVNFLRIKSADVWVRDYGPIFVRKEEGREVVATKWMFNAWGEKYDDLLADNDTGLEMAKVSSQEVITPDMVLEGGSIDSNGDGSCLTTEQCLLNKNRNPNLSKKEIEGNLYSYLGFRRIIWLGSGIEGDDTDGHIDDIARFVGRDTVVCMVENDPNEDNYAPLKRNLEILQDYNESASEKLKIVTIEMPKKALNHESRLPASYANFYIGNSCVLLPIFGDEIRDKRAAHQLSELFPSRKVVPIECNALVEGFGGIHCVTQQQPSG